MLYAIYFSPTNTTATITKTVANAIDHTYQTLDLTMPLSSSLSFEPDDVIIWGIPVYGGRVPALATKRFLQLHGQQTKAIIIAVYGNRAYEDALVEMQDLCSAQNFQVIGAISAIAKHSIVPTIAAKRPDQDDINTLKAMASQLHSKLTNQQTSTLILPGNRPYKTYAPKPIHLIIDDNCNHCMTCQKLCPAQAIDTHDPSLIDTSRCISCMRCVDICPKQARHGDPDAINSLAARLHTICSDHKSYELFI